MKLIFFSIDEINLFLFFESTSQHDLTTFHLVLQYHFYIGKIIVENKKSL